MPQLLHDSDHLESQHALETSNFPSHPTPPPDSPFFTLYLLPISPDASLLLQSENRSHQFPAAVASYTFACHWLLPLFTTHCFRAGALTPVKPELACAARAGLCCDGKFCVLVCLVKGNPNSKCSMICGVSETVFLGAISMRISRLSREDPPSPVWAGASQFFEGRGGTKKQRKLC